MMVLVEIIIVMVVWNWRGVSFNPLYLPSPLCLRIF